MLISVYSHFEHMLEVWCVFTLVTGWITFKATRKPLHPKTPRCAGTANSQEMHDRSVFLTAAHFDA
jgi:hypothetical protein